MCSDGTLTGFDTSNTAFWTSPVNSSNGVEAMIDGSGNLFILGSQDNMPISITWETNSSQEPPYSLVMQDDRNIVIYNAQGGVTWSAGCNV